MQMCAPQPFQSTHLRWRAVTQRDPAAHFSFIYGVKTTFIYCRPTCTARVARRANIVYYDTPSQAQLDGFRPCTRCKPDDSTFLGQSEEVVVRTLGLLRDCNSSSSSNVKGGVKTLAEEVGVTPSYLCRVFKRTMGCTLGEYCRNFNALPTTNDGKVATASSNPSPTHASSKPGIEPPQRDTHASPTSSTDGILTPAQSSPGPGSKLDLLSSTEENLDFNLDFDEWVWTEGCDFNDWTMPLAPASQDNHVYG